MKCRTTVLIFLLTVCLFCACRPAEAQEINYKTYNNVRFGYQVQFPDIFHSRRTSDNSDGITLTTADKKCRLLLWGGHNIGNDSIQALLQQKKALVSGIKSEQISNGAYAVQWSGSGQDSGFLFYEYKLTDKDKIAAFQFRYPAKEQARYEKIIETMKPSLLFVGDISALLNALAFSQTLHYDAFDTKPDALTANLVIFDLVRQKQFANPDNPSQVFELADGAYYFSDGPESEQEKPDPRLHYSPNKLYRSYFACGKYAYPPAGFIPVKGTQTGIAVYVSDGPHAAEAEVLRDTTKANIRMIETEIRKISYDGKPPVKLGKASVTLKQDPKSYFGYTIISFRPLYGKFADIPIQ